MLFYGAHYIFPRHTSGKHKIKFYITLITLFILFALVRTYKFYELCQSDQKNYMKMVGLSVMFSMFVVGGTMGFNYIAASPEFKYIPFIGLFLRIWDGLKYIKGSQYAITLTTAHLIMNLAENNPSYVSSLC
jgi:hypothetical protein